jgi:hypothetical protein
MTLPLFNPDPVSSLLENTDALFSTEFNLGLALADLRRHQRTYPNPEIPPIIGLLAAVIDNLSDVRTGDETRFESAPERRLSA